MYGVIIGDVSGSYLEVLEILEKKKGKIRTFEERMKIMNKNTPLFDDNSSCTDDSILTIAIGDAILNNRNYGEVLREYGEKEINEGFDKYGRSKFGYGFVKWIKKETDGTSFGNGAGMRISPVGYLFDDEETVLNEAKNATIPSHNHPESIKGAQEIAMTIYLSRNGYTKSEIKNYLKNKFDLNLNFDLDNLRHNYQFESKIMESVPQAIFCFLESNDFEDAIRKSISIGGDTDTIASMVGGIAEAYYGVPEHLIEQVQKYIPQYFKPIINKFYKTKQLTL